MDTKVSITNSRENELQFDITVEGTSVKDMRARFVIKTDGVEYVFPCKQSDKARRLTVIIPKMAHLKTGEYDFYIEVITNGYYFDPYKGKLEVTPEPTVTQTDVRKRLPVPVIKAVKVKGEDEPEEMVATEKEETKIVKAAEKDLGSKARDLVDTFLKNRTNKPPVPKSEETEKDKAVKAALKAINIKPIKISEAPLPRLPSRVTENKAPPKKRAAKKIVEENKRSALDSVIENLDVPTNEQAKKVHDIINSVKKDNDK